MALKQRQKDILLKIVEEYIDSAQPISSKLLKEKYKFNLSPATLRLEMQELTKKGFLLQPHTSAGRVPTEKGYRFFVDEVKKGAEEFGLEDYLDKDFENEINFINFLTKKLAELSRALISIYIDKENLLFESGWQEVLQEPEFKNESCLCRFARFSKKIEKIMENWEQKSEIEIYIGREIPVRESEGFSIILMEAGLPEIGKTKIYLSGPQRMDYNKNICLFCGLKKYLKNL